MVRTARSVCLRCLGLRFRTLRWGPSLILVFSIEIGLAAGIRSRRSLLITFLPAATLGAALAAILTRMVRGSMLEELSSDYVRTARAKGLSTERGAVSSRVSQCADSHHHHSWTAVRDFAGGTIVTETIFSWPGIGRLTVQAISSRDYPLLQGCILVIALSYVLVNLLTDVLYSVIDPRVRLS